MKKTKNKGAESEKKSLDFDTSKKALEDLGLYLTESQYKDLCTINFFMTGSLVDENFGQILYYILLIIRTLGLFPSKAPDQVCDDNSRNSRDEDFNTMLERVLGKIKK